MTSGADARTVRRTDAIIRRAIGAGCDALRILDMFRDPHFHSAHSIWRAHGEAFVEERIGVVLARWERRLLRTARR